MTDPEWNTLGPREKQILAILRRADGTLPSREVLLALREEGDDVAYTTVSTILDRLVEKGVVEREKETHSGSPRYLHSFEPADHLPRFVDSVVDDVGSVLGDAGLERLAARADAARTASESSLDDRSDHKHTTTER